MTMDSLLSLTFSRPSTVWEESSTVTADPPKMSNTDTRSSPLASRDSSDSMASLTSFSTTESATESDSVVSVGRRQIFSEYWKTSTPVIPADIQDDIEEEEDDGQPMSPLVQHYPSGAPGSSPTSTIHLTSDRVNKKSSNMTKALAASPPRRSIFGNARSNSYNKINNKDIDLDRFFSKHEHMTVLSSSLHSTSSTDLLLQRRLRSYSCSDVSAATAAARSTLRKGPLASCLKRRNSHGIPRTGDSQMERQPSVTFDSQISIVAFQPTSSFDEEPSCMDGSWTDLFEH
uniref:Uncharacterized protein n=1 Tax=Pseudo-nitzschia delicatissima TaxID=44447 RepID=A0A7S0UF99_9STRA|mmetsp:Transcript_1945/g.4051  ORF Transcript_1945/g.4051 Transcript_1945/m.4051 type:complete len:288 (+) Transcript_1945:104-967(+)